MRRSRRPSKTRKTRPSRKRSPRGIVSPSLCPISLRLNRPSLQSPVSLLSHPPFLSLSRARIHARASLSLFRREPHNTRVPNLVDTSSTPTPRPLSSRLFSRVYQSRLVHRETRAERVSPSSSRGDSYALIDTSSLPIIGQPPGQ